MVGTTSVSAGLGAYQMWTAERLPDNSLLAASRVPSGEKARLKIGPVGPSNVNISSPVCVSQSVTSPALLPLTRMRPSGENASAFVRPRGPTNFLPTVGLRID